MEKNQIQFQLGVYPVKQVIFINFDSVTGPLLLGGLKLKYGKVDIIHQLRTNPAQTDVDLLLLTTLPVVTTCWNGRRTIKALDEYVSKRGWTRHDVRVYSLVTPLSRISNSNGRKEVTNVD